MKRFSTVLVLLLIGVAALGYYRGWFQVDEVKIRADEQQAKQAVQDLGHKVKAKTGDVVDKIKE